MTPEEKAGMKALKRRLGPISGRQWKQLRKTLQREDATLRREQDAAAAAQEAA